MINNVSITVALVVAVIAFYYKGGPESFQASVIFSFAALLNAVRHPLSVILAAQNGWGNAQVSFNRIQSLLHEQR